MIRYFIFVGFTLVFSVNVKAQTETLSTEANSNDTSKTLSPPANSNQQQDSKTEGGPKPTMYYSVFTDFKGFKGDRPNGLVQTELYLTCPLLSNPVINFPKKFSLNFLYNIVFPGIALTKLENNLRYKDLNYYVDTTLNPVDTIRHIHTFDLLRYSNLNTYLKINLLKMTFLDKYKLYFDVIGQFYSTGVRDTFLTDKEFNVNSFGTGINLRFASDFDLDVIPFNFHLVYQTYTLHSYSNNVRQREGPLYFPDNNAKNNIYKASSDKSGERINVIQAQLRYTPSKTTDGGDIFLRFTYSTNSFQRIFNENITTDFNNNYLQVQLGYSGPIKELLTAFFPSKPSIEEKKPKDDQVIEKSDSVGK